MKNRFLSSEDDTLNYRILKPLDYNPSKQYPVHLILHGAGERGRMIMLLNSHMGENYF
jgi:predicted peptidase